MDRRTFLATSAAAAFSPNLAAGEAQADPLDFASLDRLRRAALSSEGSRVLETAEYLTDILGPRLSGSPGLHKAAEWTIGRMKEWGLSNVGLEPWPTDPTGGNHGFPRGWTNTKFYLSATAPFSFPIEGMSLAWTPGTPGLVSGECALAPETTEAALKAAHGGKLRGKWVLAQNPIDMRAQWDPVARRYTASELDGLETPPRGPEFGAARAPGQPRLARQPDPFDRYAFFRDEGALGVLLTSRGQGVFSVQALPGDLRSLAPDHLIPAIAILAEHYGRIARAVKAGLSVQLEADIRNAWSPTPEMFNIVGEIRGVERPQEIVMIGAHFDSWHAATGATDNGCSCAVALEAMRLLKATGAPLKRTVRVGLWTGEEQGLIGSRLYVAKHFGGVRGAPSKDQPRGVVEPFTPDHARFQAYFNLDNGAGAVRGIYAQQNLGMLPIFRAWMELFRDIGASHVSVLGVGSTDHLSFDAAGLPGFEFIQDPLDYETKSHHTNLDFFESLQPEDLRRNAAVMSGVAFLAANHADRLPRKEYAPEFPNAGGQSPQTSDR